MPSLPGESVAKYHSRRRASDHPPGCIRCAFDRYSSEWSAESILRGKNIGLDLGGERQLDFFDLGLIPTT